MNSPDKAKKQAAPSRKRKYSRPKLHAYGAVRAITQNVGMTGAIDGGGKNPRTSL